MVIDMNYWRKVIKRIFIFFLTIIGVWLGFKLSVFYMPFLIAFKYLPNVFINSLI